VGRYYQFGVGDEVSGDSRLKGFHLRFDAEGTGAQVEDILGDDGKALILDEKTDHASRAFRWKIEQSAIGPEVVIRRTFDVGTKQYNCLYDNGATPDCTLFDERRIIPIVVNDTGRYYWVEVRRSAELVVTPDTPATHLARFYDFVPFEDTEAVSSAKTRISREGNKPRELVRGPAHR
jgi:hypothetical protein